MLRLTDWLSKTERVGLEQGTGWLIAFAVALLLMILLAFGLSLTT